MGALAFVLVGGGVLCVWAGIQDVKITDVIASVLSGSALPTKSGKKKLDTDNLASDDGGRGGSASLGKIPGASTGGSAGL